MNQTKRVAVMQRIHQACSTQKREVPRQMHNLTGKQFRKLARSLGVLDKHGR